MSSLCDAVDSRFGFAYLRTEEKPQTGREPGEAGSRNLKKILSQSKSVAEDQR